MLRAKIASIAHYVPEKVVTNDELSTLMDTNDAWIQERTGIKERRYVERFEDTTSTLGTRAARIAIERAGITTKDVDFIIFATLSPDYYFPGSGVLLQRQLGLQGIGALDIRNQCSGFVYGLSVAEQFVRTGMYKNVLLVGAEAHSIGLDYTTRGRNVSVIFGDGGGAAIIQPSTDEAHCILSSHLHADGDHAEYLSYINPGSHSGVHLASDEERERYGYPDRPYGGRFITQKMIDDEDFFPYMDGQYVFKFAVQKFPEVIMEALSANGFTPQDLNLLVPHQANLRISQFVQRKLGLRDDQVYNNIQKYGNTTAASIPIALSEAWEAGKVKSGDLVCLAAFGSGFTWASALLRW